MCNKALNNYAYVLEFVPDCYETQEMFFKAGDASPSAIQVFPESHKFKKCVFKLLTLVFLYLILFLIDIRRKKCVIKLFLIILLC